MSRSPVEPERVRALNDRPPRPDGAYVLYWMQQSQRAHGNPALEYAVWRANQLRLPLVVGFGLHAGYPDANLRHFAFLLEGLSDAAEALRDRGIPFVLRAGEPPAVAAALAERAALVVCDRGYLRHQRRWRRALADAVQASVEEVEGDVLVPVHLVSDKREFAARTIRPKVHRLWARFLRPQPVVGLRRSIVRPAARRGLDLDDSLDPASPATLAVIADLGVDPSVAPVSHLFRGGTGEARRRLAAFLGDALPRYVRDRKAPEREPFSHLGMYLHFGQISPVEIALAARGARGVSAQARAAFLEELIVRRELACNFVEFSADYDRYDGLPDWSRATLETHAADPRQPRLTRAALESARSGDAVFDAAMREMRATGYLPNALRMYWGKKILEWSASPEEAYATALALNNRYLLDGRDPNSYANIGWLFGLHDRPFKERVVFGKVRYLSAAGLARKMDVPAYLARVERLVRVATAPAARPPPPPARARPDAVS